jgi:hypothetical protein
LERGWWWGEGKRGLAEPPFFYLGMGNVVRRGVGGGSLLFIKELYLSQYIHISSPPFSLLEKKIQSMLYW